MTGRPSSFTQEIADVICEEIADGRSLRSICLDEGMPSKSAVFRWLADEERQDFRDQYARAREAQADSLFDDILQLADICRIGVKTTTKPDGTVETVTADMIERSKVQIDARKWMAGKLRPKVYGDKIQTEHSGEMTVRNASDLKDDELAAIAAGSGG